MGLITIHFDQGYFGTIKTISVIFEEQTIANFNRSEIIFVQKYYKYRSVLSGAWMRHWVTEEPL